MPPLGVVIPTLNEEPYLPGLLDDLGRLAVPADVVVVDGGSTDGTVAVARRHGARTVTAARGRATQMNVGAQIVAGDWLCFLHADVRLIDDARRELALAVEGGDLQVGVWRLAIEGAGVALRVMELGAWVRDRLGGLPYGDQGLVVRRDLFAAVGGFAGIPIMEDVAMVRALRRRARVHRFRSAVRVSPRRWRRQGPWRTWLQNIALLAGYLAGVSPQRLSRWYPPEPR